MAERKAAAETTIRLDYLARTLDEMRNDFKALPDRLAGQYATKEELGQVKQDYQTIRQDIEKLSVKMDNRDSLYQTKEESNKFLVSYKEDMVALNKDGVRQDEFIPIKRVVYGIVGVTLTSVLAAILSIVLRK
jgi:hypothetical protein